MTRHVCHTCDVLKELYWLKASHFVLAVRAVRAPATGRRINEDELQALNEDALEAFRMLLRHINSCYGLTLEKAA